MEKIQIISQYKEILHSSLSIHLQQILPPHTFAEVYQYAVFPCGKLFRPQLVLSTFLDFSHPSSPFAKNLWNPNCNHSLFASSLELHHTYTLLHDDLPCMDNDSLRRNRPTTHIKYGQWQALLAGDGLLVGSFQLLSKIKHPQFPLLAQIYTWGVGPKGLIQGQVLDLQAAAISETQTFSQLMSMHILKTSRLLQLALTGSFLLTQNENYSYRTCLNLHRLGRELGILFQLLDDLAELGEENPSSHELEINPFLLHPQESIRRPMTALLQINKILQLYKMDYTTAVIGEYLKKTQILLLEREEKINQRIKSPSLHRLILDLCQSSTSAPTK